MLCFKKSELKITRGRSLITPAMKSTPKYEKKISLGAMKTRF